MITDASPAAISAAALAGDTTPSDSPIWVEATMNGSVVAWSTPAITDFRAPSSGRYQEKRLQRTHEQYRQQEQRDARDGRCAREERVHVEVKPRRDQEDRDEDAESGGLELGRN